MSIKTTQKKKQLLIAVIAFLIIQFINLGVAGIFTTDLSMFTGDFKKIEEKQNQKIFDNLLATQTLHLEGIKLDFVENMQLKQTPIDILIRRVSTSYNFPNSVTIVLSDRQTGEVLYPYGVDMKKLTSQEGLSLQIYRQALLSNEEAKGSKFLINLREDEKLSYEEAYDFELHPIGSRNRIFVQKVILPSPSQTPHNYVVYASFRESTIRQMVGYTETEALTNKVKSMPYFLLLILGTNLFATIGFSLYAVYLVSRLKTIA